MKLDFRIDWGYINLYSRRHYHSVYRWDGQLLCNGGKILEMYQLNYPVIWFGPGHCAKETALPGNSWQSTTKRGMSGVRVVAEVEYDTEFTLQTASGTFSFTAAAVANDGRIEFQVGPKDLNCKIIVTKTGYFWFYPKSRNDEQVWEAKDIEGEHHDWARMKPLWLAPGKSCDLQAMVPTCDHSDVKVESVLHLALMAAPKFSTEKEEQISDDFPIAIFVDGEMAARSVRYLRAHDTFMQLLEDEWIRFNCPSGNHKITIRNEHDKYCLLITKATLRQSVRHHLELSLPKWALIGKEQIGKVFAPHAEEAELILPDEVRKISLTAGWNEFTFTLKGAGRNVKIQVGNSVGEIDAVYALDDEPTEVKVGFDMTTVPHDGYGIMDWLLDYTWRTQLGNIVVFRNFRTVSPENLEISQVPDGLLKKWGAFCKDHHIYVEAATDFDSGALIESAGNYMHYAGRHEWPGAVYAFDPDEKWGSNNMKEAMEHYLTYMKPEIERVHKVGGKMAFGDASGGHRYCYMAGADFLRTETMVPHTQHLCSQARPAAEALGSGEWGVHIAIQHARQPYFETHLGEYFLCLFQPWVMGASMIYEEDSLFQMFKEERQAWDDLLTKGKRDMTRDFFRFVKTHPRHGAPQRQIAFLEGRYAAPFNGFICDVEQTPDYSVWGRFGNPAPEWGHRQPEKCRQILDVLMPGASTLPLRQKFDKRRFFFSGTPFGDFDEVPIEAQASYLSQYSLLLNLGWNTCLDEDIDKLRAFVRGGGTLFTGLPQFSKHVKRDFLLDMRDLNLWNNGDLSEFCGVKIRGASDVEFKGNWNCANRPNIKEVELSAIPSASPEEDGSCKIADIEMCGVTPVVWDADSGLPLILRFNYGKGQVYLLATFAYPGHEKLQKLAATFTAILADKHKGEIYVEDDSGEIFWNVWEENDNVQRVYMLNTDWSAKGNVKQVMLHTPRQAAIKMQVTERVVTSALILPNAVVEIPMAIHIEVKSVSDDSATLVLHGVDTAELKVHYAFQTEQRQIDFGDKTELEIII